MTPETYDIKLIIPGEPRHQQRHRSTIRMRAGAGVQVKMDSGKIETLYRKKDLWIMNYDPSATDKKDIRRLTVAMAPRPILDGPLRVDITFYYLYRKKHYGTGRNTNKLKPSAPTWKSTAPDRDNAEKIYLDALKGIFWKNDAIICDGPIRKLYAEIPRTEIYITILDAQKQENLFERSNQDGKARICESSGSCNQGEELPTRD